MNTGRGFLIALDPYLIITAVAAAASVPFSSTAIKALWMTSPIYKFHVPSIPEKSAFSLKATDMPRDINISESFKDSVVNLYFGT